ncbi:MAG: hypothetical protein M1812_001456 [Candelaria pacifica]|nr:MAG: hypothetical protein M1812_001456 [Candelaria pacifica]
MKVTSSHLLTAFAACTFCSVAVARPIGDVDLQAPNEGDDSSYLGIAPTDLGRRQDVVDQDADDDDDGEPNYPDFIRRQELQDQDDSDQESSGEDDFDYSGFSRRSDSSASDAYDESEEDYPSEITDPSLGRRVEIPGIKVPKPGDGAATGAGSAAGSVGKTPGEGSTGAGGVAQSDTHIGADTSTAGKSAAGDTHVGAGTSTAGKSVAGDTGSATKANPKQQPGLNPEQQSFWEVGDQLMKDVPKAGAKDVTKYKPYKDNYALYDDKSNKKLGASQATWNPHDLDKPFQDMHLDVNGDFRTMEIRSKASGSKDAVLTCDMSKKGPPTFIAEMKFKEHDMNAKGDQLPTWVISQQAMKENGNFKPENLFQRDVINAGTQRTVVAARKELGHGPGDYFKLDRNSDIEKEQKWFKALLATDNIRPSAVMLNKYPEYFGGKQIQTMHFWKPNDVISEEAIGTLPIMMALK